jgi:hypothetical protein
MLAPGTESVSGQRIRSGERTCQDAMTMTPFKVDPSWYERYWWSDPAPERTDCRPNKAKRGRLLRTADAMKVAINAFVKIPLAALRLHRRRGHR